MVPLRIVSWFLAVLMMTAAAWAGGPRSAEPSLAFLAAMTGQATSIPSEPMRRGWCRHEGDRASVVDFNGDGIDDVACQSASGDVRVLLTTTQGLAPAGTHGDGLLLESWCPSPEADLIWADLDGDGRGDALCLRRDGHHAAMRSTGAALQRVGSGTEGRLIDGWCAAETVQALLASAPGDGSIELRCGHLPGALRLQVETAQRSAEAPRPMLVAAGVSPRQWASERGLQLPIQARGGQPEPLAQPPSRRWLSLMSVGLVLLLIVPLWRRNRAGGRADNADAYAVIQTGTKASSAAARSRRADDFEVPAMNGASKRRLLGVGLWLCVLSYAGSVVPSSLDRVHGDRDGSEVEPIDLPAPVPLTSRPAHVWGQQAATLRDR